MQIALAQINPTVGDIAGNTRKIIDFIGRAREGGAELVLFPELAIVGYPPKDLLLKLSFVSDNLVALDEIAAVTTGGITAIVGYVDRNTDTVGRTLYNAAAVCAEGAVKSRHFKTLLPTYDVFDESRYFEPFAGGERSQIVDVNGVKIGISICEDLWNDERLISRRLYHQNPMAGLDAAGAQIMVNISASPFVMDKHEMRLKLCASAAQQFDNPFVYVNQIGGNDELVFDGNSFVMNAKGELLAQAKGFQEDLIIVDVSPSATSSFRGTSAPLVNAARPPDHEWGAHATLESIYNALVLGLRDYAQKCGFKSVVLGLSGGIDSALVCAIAAAALGSKNVVGVAMPSRYSSDHSVSDAEALAKNLGIKFHIVPIKDIHDAFEASVTPHFAGRAADVTEENLQARTRGAILMAFSNKFNHLLLTTGNKSEVGRRLLHAVRRHVRRAGGH